MNSQETLVNLPSQATPHTVYSFAADSMKNTTIHTPDDRIVYTVQTDKITDSVTTIFRANSTSDIIAVVNRRNILPDTISFGGGPSGSLSKWLHGKAGKWTDYPISFEWEGQTYTWKTNANRQIALYIDSDLDHAVAWFASQRRPHNAERHVITPRALLAVETAALGIIDVVVVSLLVVEQNLRIRETRAEVSGGKFINEIMGYQLT